MALAIDASTPAFAAAVNDPWTTASFTPPNDSLLVVVACGDWFGGTPTLTPTSTGLTFTSRIKQGALNQGVVQIWTAEVGSNGGSARTVSVTTSLSSDTGGVKVYVLTGQDATNYFDTTGGGTSTTYNVTVIALTTGFDNCWVVGGGTEWNALGTPTSTDVHEEFDDAGALDVMCVRKSAATATAGTVTLNFDAAGSGAARWTWAAISIRPAASGQSVAIGTATETDTALLFGDSSNVLIATETDFPIALGRRKSRTPAFALETEAALPIGRRKSRALGLGLETDTAVAILRNSAGISLPVVLEVDAAQPVGRRKIRLLGTALETNTALEVKRPMKRVKFPTYKERLGNPRLLNRYTLKEPVSLLKKNGVWTEVVSPHQDEIAAAEGYYQGGILYVLTDAQAADLPPQYVEEILP